MSSQNFAIENPEVFVMSYAPGVIDTPMQADVTKFAKEDFPSLQRFIDLHESGSLIAADEPAKEIFDLVQSPKLGESNFLETRYGV